MVSPELLRRYPFFRCLDDTQQKAIAMITEEASYEAGTTLFQEGQPADTLYLLMEGSIDLYFTVGSEPRGVYTYPTPVNEPVKEFFVGEINPGEPFGISALIEPYQLTASARAHSPSRVLKIEAAGLRALCEVDCRMGYGLMRQVAKAALERLHYTRVQLVGARA